MYLINKSENKISKIEEKSFSELGFKERNHLQEWIANNPECLGEEILIIQKEFSGFDDTNERLDLLGLDKKGNLVIIENKLDDSGKDVTWQSIKYASYCSTLTKEQIIRIYQSYLNKFASDENAIENLISFFDASDISDVIINSGSKQRIILIAANFRKEVTSTVLWLMSYNLRIQCFKVTPLQLNNQLFLEVKQIIPVKETEDYQIKIAEKTQDEIIQQDSSKALDILYMNFWEYLLSNINAKSPIFKNVSPSSKNYIGISAIYSGMSFYFTVSKTQNFGRIELYIRSNDEAFEALKKQSSEIEAQFGNKLVWHHMKKDCKVKYEIEIKNLENKESWNVIASSMTTNMIKLYDAFQPFLENLKRQMKS